MIDKKLNGAVSFFYDFNQRFCFFIENENDLIQRHHSNGDLYEKEELQMIYKHAFGVKNIFDIGANVGNHTAFFL